MSNKNKNLIVWEKWSDPYSNNNDDDYDWSDFEQDEDDNKIDVKYEKYQAIITNMGIIPYNESTDSCKIFNFWTGHTNFDITNNIGELIEFTEGVETLDIFTRYRFRIGIGKAFNERDVINNINNKIINI